MGIALGIVAVALVGGGPTGPDEAPWIGTTIRVVDAPLREWRGAHQTILSPVGRQGNCQIWLVPRDTADAIAAAKGTVGKSAATVQAAPGAPGTVNSWTIRSFVTDVKPPVHGPAKGTVKVTGVPVTEAVAEGIAATIIGHETKGGMVATIELESAWVAEVVEVEGSASKSGNDSTLAGKVQVPQVVHGVARGVWAIPDGQVLLISVGSHGSDDAKGKKIERLAIVDPRIIPAPPGEVVPTAYEPESIKVEDRPAARLARAMPPLPSRSPLPARGPDGLETPLPTLPDPQVVPATVAGPPIPRPSPQTTVSTPSIRFDPEVATAHYEPMPIGRAEIRLDGGELSKLKTQTIRIPLGGKLSIELKARVVPFEQPD